MTFFKWPRTASSNASADASINWAEGQAPSSVNDSARAMMAAAAKYRDDIAGATITSGTSTAYTLSSWQVFDSLAHLDGAMVAFTPHTGNGATVTLNVDSTGAKPLRSAPGVELPTGALIQGTPYLAIYNNSDGAFYLRGGSPYPYLIPLGGMLPYIGSIAPNSAFVSPSGQAISRITYATLFSLIGTVFGSGDGSTTFNVPDLRGRVWAGLDTMGGFGNVGRLSSVISSSVMGATGGGQNQSILQGHLPNINFPVTDPGHLHATTDPNGLAYLLHTGGISVNTTGPTGTAMAFSGAADARSVGTGAHTTGISVASGGSGVALNTTQPTIVGNWILRVI